MSSGIRFGLPLAAAGLVCAGAPTAMGFAYIFAGEANGVDVVTHSIGYTGVGGVVNVTVGIDNTSVNAAAMEISTQNVVTTWNQLNATTGNIDFAPFNPGEVLLDSNQNILAGSAPAPDASSGSSGVSSAQLFHAGHDCLHASCSLKGLTSAITDGPDLSHGDPTPSPTSLNAGPAPGQVDFESTLLHELGHSLGLAHVNAASESGLTGGNANYTKATNGANNVFDINPGVDGIIGTADDVRGDDVNLNYFFTADNDPFDTSNVSGVVDSTTFSRDVADLPVGDNFSANADRDVATALGYNDGDGTEAVMQQGAFFGENQRTLTADDVAGIRYAQAGLDNLEGTADDYVLVLTYVGQTNDADILIDFDNSETGFAVSQSNGQFLSPDDVVITANSIFFNSGFDWFFNDTLIPEPNTLALVSLGGLFVLRRRRSA